MPRPSIGARADIAAHTRTARRPHPPVDMPPDTGTIKSYASSSGSIAPPTSGTPNGTP
ncbi:hypothetical protein QFZ24_002950 [Streptomyces phaeochromogenes]|uniref:hypothetical protein n=1 Tax=Streptomyces TaxID=1883 RepID=UPI00163D7C2C|nr:MULTISPECIES: hypothetical protein [Streptomyces]MDQ0949027.1 hypothetical protein [Streptomyces phaeochromogenes]